jgi:Flp pilus assembly protein TadD/tRNA A-37 threonylcarbamoyl transferase component Bud32
MLSHYRLVEKIGAGGMGVVYRAHDTRLKRDVAIKVLSPQLISDPQLRRRFRREARAAAAVTHSNIATIHEIDEADGVTFIVMELVDGRSLRSLIRDGPLPIGESVRIATELAEGLARAHEARIVHRDLKPDNVLLASDRHVKILDFGLAKLLEDRDAARRQVMSQAATATGEVTRQGQLVGTPRYMSPEQARGERADERSDIFSFGITLYEMVTGKRPFEGRNQIETLAEILHTPPVPAASINTAIPPRLNEILEKCLEKDPKNRYRNAGELAIDLRELQESILTPIPVEPAPPAQPIRVRAALIGLIALVLVAVSIVVMVFVLRGPVIPAASQGVAILPLDYEGPETKAHLKSVIPILFTERMRNAQGLRVAPFDFSRNYQPDEDPGVVARDLGVDRVVGGRLTITDETFDLTVWTMRPDDKVRTWTGTRAGELSALFAQAGMLAVEAVEALGAGPVYAAADNSRLNTEALELYLQGRIFLEGWDFKRNYARAAEAAQSAIDIDPGFAAAHALLSRALMTQYVQTNEPALVHRALDAAERAVTLAPTLPEAHAALGMVNVWRGRSAEAVRSYQEGLRLAPADDALMRGFARAYSKLGRDEDAEAMYRRAIALRPTYWAHHNSLGVFFYRRGRLDEAKEQFRQVIELRPGSDTGYSNLAAVHILAGEHAEAVPLLRAALNIDPAHNTRNNLGVVYYATDRFEDAAREWQANVDAGADTVMYLSNLGDAYRQLDRPDEARRAYDRAIELGREQLQVDTDNAEARAMYSIALAGSGRCDESRQNAGRAMKDAPGNPTLCYYAAIAAAICGDRDTAVLHTRCAIEGGIKVDVTTNPDLKPLLDEPSLQALLG